MVVAISPIFRKIGTTIVSIILLFVLYIYIYILNATPLDIFVNTRHWTTIFKLWLIFSIFQLLGTWKYQQRTCFSELHSFQYISKINTNHFQNTHHMQNYMQMSSSPLSLSLSLYIYIYIYIPKISGLYYLLKNITWSKRKLLGIIYHQIIRYWNSVITIINI